MIASSWQEIAISLTNHLLLLQNRRTQAAARRAFHELRRRAGYRPTFSATKKTAKLAPRCCQSNSRSMMAA